MKKTIVIIALSLSALLSGTAIGQERPSFGINLGANLTNVKLTDIDGSGAKFHGGAYVGGYSKIYISPVFSVQPELTVSYTEAKIKAGGERLKFKYVSVEIPVWLQANIKAGSGQVVLAVGPNIGYGISADTRVENRPEPDTPGEVIQLDHWYAGWGVSAGYEFRNRMSVTAAYRNSYDFSSRHKSSDIRTATISLGIGYRF